MSNDIVCDSAQFGRNFQTARVRAGLSLGELARRLNDVGVKSDSGAMSKLERDMQEPGVIWAAHAALALETTLDGLVYRKKPDVPIHRQLSDAEKNSLLEFIEITSELTLEEPKINWFEIATNSARGILDALKAKTILPMATSISEPAPNERVYEPPPETKEQRTRGGGTAKHDLMASEDAPVYGENNKNEG